MDLNKDPFDNLYVHLNCPTCGEYIVVGLSDNIVKYGFVCPFCNNVTDADNLWETVLKSRITGSSED